MPVVRTARGERNGAVMTLHCAPVHLLLPTPALLLAERRSAAILPPRTKRRSRAEQSADESDSGRALARVLDRRHPRSAPIASPRTSHSAPLRQICAGRSDPPPSSRTHHTETDMRTAHNTSLCLIPNAA